MKSIDAPLKFALNHMDEPEGSRNSILWTDENFWVYRSLLETKHRILATNFFMILGMLCCLRPREVCSVSSIKGRSLNKTMTINTKDDSLPKRNTSKKMYHFELVWSHNGFKVDLYTGTGQNSLQADVWD